MELEHVHRSIHSFLQRQPVLDAQPSSGAAPDKAGILPVAGLHVCLMRPQAARPELGPPPFQLCKGTRMYRHEGMWRDMKSAPPANAELEPLPVTALREGMEELGLKLENVAAMLDLGSYAFASASHGTPKSLQLYAVALHRAGNFLPFSAIASTTAERRWVAVDQYEALGRPDHAAILRQALAAIKEHSLFNRLSTENLAAPPQDSF